MGLSDTKAMRSAKTWTFLGAAMAICLASLTGAQATVTPYVVSTSGFSEYTLIMDSPSGGYINQSTINGDAGIVSRGQSSNYNNDIINGSLDYTQSNFLKNFSSITVNGESALSTAPVNASAAASSFAQTVANFTISSGNALTSNYNQGLTLTASSDLNVFSIGNNSNVNGTIKLVGDSNDVFYINVYGNLNLSSIDIGNVSAKNVYWNIIGNGKVSLNNGTYYGSFLTYEASASQSLTINNATLEGNIYGGSMGLSSATINGVPLSEALAAPEPGSVAAIVLFGMFLFGSAAKRMWERRRQVPEEAAAA